MKPSLFIDTGAFYARYVAQDEYHQEARQLWDRVQKEGILCLTTNLVLVELISLFVYRFGTKRALQAAREIYSSQIIEILSVTTHLELAALEWLDRFSDQKFSMTDAVSFAVMADLNLKQAFAFDHHFEIAGFQRFL